MLSLRLISHSAAACSSRVVSERRPLVTRAPARYHIVRYKMGEHCLSYLSKLVADSFTMFPSRFTPLTDNVLSLLSSLSCDPLHRLFRPFHHLINVQLFAPEMSFRRAPGMPARAAPRPTL